MSDRGITPIRALRRIGPRLAPLALVLVVAIGVAVGAVDGLGLGAPASVPARAFQATLDGTDARGRVLVAFDPDIGTYAEIRPAVRAALAQLAGHGASLSFISFSAEGRALAIAELARLERGGVESTRLLDLGFRAGAEAALIAAVRSAVPAGASGALAEGLRADGGGLGAFDLALVVGGTDIGPRSWVEQVAPRARDLATVAIVPTVLAPLTAPYERSGQLQAVLGTTRDDAAYVALVLADPTVAGRDATTVEDLPPAALPILLGMLLTLGALADAIATRLRAPGAGGERAA